MPRHDGEAAPHALMSQARNDTGTHELPRSPPGADMQIDKQGKIVETALEARGAELGPSMRNVLVLSISLVVVAFVVVYAVFVAD
jgi:hypothetical protein